MSDNLALLVRLDASQGFYNMGDLMPLVDYLRKRGVHAVIEMAPGAPMEGAHVHYVKVPEELLELAQGFLKDYFSQEPEA